MKRMFDAFLSGFALFFLILPLVVIFFLVLFKMGRPVFFRQARPGLNGAVFELVKFRTMRNPVLGGVGGNDDGSRITRFGQFLRSTSLDELPGLWNVLTGKMSLVGPRPLLVEYMPLYTPRQARRHEVRPGITGWAQVNGRNSLNWEEKFDLDVWYVDNRSFWLDLKILFLTVRKVLVRDGINATGEATMPRFLGTRLGEEK